jgi:hypothetical protein
LSETNWNIETEVFPTNQQVMPFTIAEQGRTNLMVWARDWTGITSYGNQTPEWWLWEYFGTVDLSDANLDAQGQNTLWDDYQNGSDPNIISFLVDLTTSYIATSSATVQITVSEGTPSYMAVLVDGTNFSAADWTPYNSNPAINLGSVEGWHVVWVGLRGLPPDAQQTWEQIQLKLILTPPVLILTNPVAGIVTQPMIELQGFCTDPLASLTFDLSNAAGFFSNQQALVLSQYYDTNAGGFTTNTFQAFDVPLTNGDNVVTFHATDMAGNVTTTNFTYTLDYSGKTNPPVIQVFWPQNGEHVSGTEFTLRGSLDDFTASLTAQIVNASGGTNTVQGLVERNRLYWVENAPLLAGTNYVTLTAMDAAGNIATTNLTISVSGGLTIDDFSYELGGTPRNIIPIVTGTVALTNYTIWVNGVQASQDGQGNWAADSVPLGPGGTAVVEVSAIPNSDNNGYGTGTAPSSDGTPGNPTAPDSMTAEVQIDQPAALYLQEYHYKGSFTISQDYLAQAGGGEWQYSFTGQVDDVYMNGGSANDYMSDSLSGCIDSPSDFSEWDNDVFSWPCDQCPATEVYTDSYGDNITIQEDVSDAVGSVQNYSIFSYGMPMAEWNMSQHFAGQFSYGSYIVDQKQSIISQMTLQTGGKGVAGSQRMAASQNLAGSQNLFEIDVSALKWQPYGVINADVSCVPGVYSTAIPPGEITDQGQTANAIGLILVGVPANAAVPITPQAPVQSYTYPMSGATEYQAQIQANGFTLDPVNTNATFCVGQQITFTLIFSPIFSFGNGTSLNIGDEFCSWTLPAKFVNVATPIAFGCTNYTTNYSLLDTTNNTCTCWYVNGSGGTVSVGAYLIMPNGKSVSVAAIGQFAIYRPSLSAFNQQFYDLTWAFPYLGADMSWTMNVDSTFNGQYGITQLLLGTGVYYNTDGQYFLDGNSPIYGEINTNGPSPYYTNNIGSQTLTFQDTPSAPTTSLNLTFQDYLVFQPVGQNSIFVTLATNGWSVNASVNPLTGVLTPSNISPAIIPVDSDVFPYWNEYRPGH